MKSETFSTVRARVSEAAARSHVPYSGRADAAILVLADGAWIPGVRIETASFSLSIPPLVNAVTTAVSLGRNDVVAAAISRPFTPAERAYASACALLDRLTPAAADVLTASADTELSPRESLPPYVQQGAALDPKSGITLAREVAERAYVPESGFPVGCAALTRDGYVPGVNVEHPDWMHILCAERNALGTCISYGLGEISSIFLTCLKDAACTPCGACRQLLVELAPTAALWMDRGSAPPRRADPDALLPGSFGGEHLTPNT